MRVTGMWRSIASVSCLAACGGAKVIAPPPTAPPVCAPQPARAPDPPSAKGVWLGALGGAGIRAQIRFDPEAKPACTFDSVDQGMFGIGCNLTAEPSGNVVFEVPSVNGKWAGALSADGSTLTGTWTQPGTSQPLALKREDKPIAAPKPVMLAALPPATADQVTSVLDADLAPAIDHGELAPKTGVGVTIGIVVRGKRKILTYGSAKPDSVYEIGSVTKTFTSLVLAQMAAQKKVRLDEAVRDLLPAGTAVAPPSDREMTLTDLTDHHSGLPPLPENFERADPHNPYADYDDKHLYAWLSARGLAVPHDADYLYSNLGVGLLGNLLAHKAGKTYEALLRDEVTSPLGMNETSTTLTKAMTARLAQGHDAAHQPARPWDFLALAGCGAIHSTAKDMLTYLVAQGHPESLNPSTSPNAKTIAFAIAETHVVRADAMPKQQIALSWFRDTRTGSYWHDGGTGGYSSFALWSPVHDFAVVVLSNVAPGTAGFADKLGKHIEQRLLGVEASDLTPTKSP